MWKKTFSDLGITLMAPNPMTKAEFIKWRKSPEGRRKKKSLIATKELRGTPTWLTLSSIFPYASKSTIDSKAKQNLKKRGVKPTADECQTPSQKKQLGKGWEDFVRVKEYSDSPQGKRAAENYADELRDFKGEDTDENTKLGEEGDRQVRVLRAYCRDVPEEGWYWTVWIREKGGKYIDTGSVKRGQKTRFSGDKYRSGIRETGKKGKYHTGKSKKIVDNAGCPTCEAEKGENCVTPKGARTNPHQSRIKLYTEK